jgi:hypothetical protein
MDAIDLDVMVTHIRILRGAIQMAVEKDPKDAITGIASYFEDCGVDDPETRELLDRWWKKTSREPAVPDRTVRQPRLFVMAPSSDSGWWHCGGPNLADAMRGLSNLIEGDVGELLAGNKLPDSPIGKGEFLLKVELMTLEEVDALPDGG